MKKTVIEMHRRKRIRNSIRNIQDMTDKKVTFKLERHECTVTLRVFFNDSLLSGKIIKSMDKNYYESVMVDLGNVLKGCERTLEALGYLYPEQRQ